MYLDGMKVMRVDKLIELLKTLPPDSIVTAWNLAIIEGGEQTGYVNFSDESIELWKERD